MCCKHCSVIFVAISLWLCSKIFKSSRWFGEFIIYTIYHGKMKFIPPVFEKIRKNTTHRGLRSTPFIFVEFWKTFGENKCYLKKSIRTQRNSDRKTTYFAVVSFNKLKLFSFISWNLSLFILINLLHKTQLLLLSLR